MTTPTRWPVFCAALGAGLVLLWQALTVHYNYQDDWSSLFHTGSYLRLPPAIAAEDTFRFQGPGYDGQFYHFVAHDPFLRAGTQQYVDNPRLRWRRILVPALAWLLAAGDSDYIDSTYVIVVLAFIFLGVYWLSAYSARLAVHPAFGLLFLLAPAVLVSIDYFTVDVALAALCCALALYGSADRSWRVFLMLALAPLARETGITFIAAYILASTWRRMWRGVLLGLLAACPYLVWLTWLARHTGPDFTPFVSWPPFHGLIARTLHPVQYVLSTTWLKEAAVLDYLAVLGIWTAVALTARLVWRKPDLLFFAAALFTAIFVAFVNFPDVWSQATSFTRTMSPLVIWLALIGMAQHSWLYFLPWALTCPRLLFQLGPEWRGILHGLRH